MARIFVDTNVLFPFSVMDLLLALSEDGVHTVVWTDALLDEWERVIVDEQRCRRSRNPAAGRFGVQVIQQLDVQVIPQS